MRALVTGAGAKGGIGMAVARALGRAGCEVALVSTTDRIHERAAELMAEGLKATGHIADLTDAVQVAALREAGDLVGHVHFADSNRRAIGFGQTNVASIIAALRAIGYQGYLSAEIFPLPDARSAAAQTIQSFKQALASL